MILCVWNICLSMTIYNFSSLETLLLVLIYHTVLGEAFLN